MADQVARARSVHVGRYVLCNPHTTATTLRPAPNRQVVDFTFEGGVAELCIGEASVGDIRLQVGRTSTVGLLPSTECPALKPLAQWLGQ